MVQNSPFFAESKVQAPPVSNCFPLNSSKKMGFARTVFFVKKTADWQFWHDPAGPLPTVSDSFRLFPTVSDCFIFSGRPASPVDHWIKRNRHVQHFAADPCARRLLEIMHFDFKTQDTLKIPKFQDLVKFYNVYIIQVQLITFISRISTNSEVDPRPASHRAQTRVSRLSRDRPTVVGTTWRLRATSAAPAGRCATGEVIRGSPAFQQCGPSVYAMFLLVSKLQ